MNRKDMIILSGAFNQFGNILLSVGMFGQGWANEKIIQTIILLNEIVLLGSVVYGWFEGDEKGEIKRKDKLAVIMQTSVWGTSFLLILLNIWDIKLCKTMGIIILLLTFILVVASVIIFSVHNEPTEEGGTE